MDTGVKPSSTLQQRNLSELARGAIAEWKNFNLADTFPASKGETKALYAEIDILRQQINLLNGTEHGVRLSLKTTHAKVI